MRVLACRAELKWSQEKIHTYSFYLFCVCVDDVVRLGVAKALEMVQIFILAERLQVEFFGIIR